MGIFTKYEVTRIALRQGKDLRMESFDDRGAAIESAKRKAKSDDRICVIEARYASQNYFDKRLSIDSHIIWAAWLNVEE